MKNKRKKLWMAVLMAVLLISVLTVPVFAETNDPIEVVNNLSDFMFGLVRAVGMVMLGFAVVQIGLSLKSHDPSQRANGFLTLAGGVVITFAKEILTLITG
ncbi:MAG: glutamyl-tRNA amidotransferase [Clostridia bacterium]|nr:glutamyl-tRNA amidotransferase [Clostridia bacterium]